mmetsp:Transcript_27097/g.47912  ORF Transcript_27097/g.47912 Transcript_27097/m.47912 type:complete len:531 (+) Transcript_27097:335-1927(+)
MYMFCLLIWWKIAPLMGSGPQWFRWHEYTKLCDSYWWTNLFFVNNLVPFGEGENATCFFHSWYMANDMQFFALTPLFLLVYLHSKKWAVALCIFTVCASVIAAFLAAKTYAWSSANLDGAAVITYDREGYIFPWFRIPAYAIGMLLAIARLQFPRNLSLGLGGFNQNQNQQQQVVPGMRMSMSRKMSSLVISDPYLNVVIEGLGLSLLLLCVFGGIDAYQARPCAYDMWPGGANVACGSGPEWDTTERAAYASFTKPAWCVGLALLCWVSFQGQAGFVGWLLNHDAWVVPARLSFGMYLLHPLVINVWFQKQTQFFRWSAVDFMLRFFGVFAGTFLATIALNLVVEGPFSLLSKEWLKWFARKTSSSSSSKTTKQNQNQLRIDPYQNTDTSDRERDSGSATPGRASGNARVQNKWPNSGSQHGELRGLLDSGSGVGFGFGAGSRQRTRSRSRESRSSGRKERGSAREQRRSESESESQSSYYETSGSDEKKENKGSFPEIQALVAAEVKWVEMRSQYLRQKIDANISRSL